MLEAVNDLIANTSFWGLPGRSGQITLNPKINRLLDRSELLIENFAHALIVPLFNHTVDPGRTFSLSRGTGQAPQLRLLPTPRYTLPVIPAGIQWLH